MTQNSTNIAGIVLALASVCLTSCAVVQKTPEAVAEKMTVERDDYEKVTTLSTPRYYKPHAGLLANEIGHHAYLKCFLFDKTMTYSLILRIIYSGQTWAFLERAADSEGNDLPTKSIARDVMTAGMIREVININLTKEYLEEHVDTGLDIQVSGNRGSMILKYPS